MKAGNESRVKVQLSRIPSAGLGLFTTEFVKKGELLCRYSGEILTTSQAIQLKDKRYLMRLGEQCYIDALNSTSSSLCLARYINDCRNSAGINVKFEKHPELGCAFVVALRDIEPGYEIYGIFTTLSFLVAAKVFTRFY